MPSLIADKSPALYWSRYLGRDAVVVGVQHPLGAQRLGQGCAFAWEAACAGCSV